ncbi:hypothetical protein EI77_02001 [Prosthecobacter fusiformis]|uniref:Type IV pilus assembly protein PilO n=1 Tax=Prosthecobacter fusiformis TaxID=48464 RepID=A0A4V3FFI0_9BACT|nr:hypothetical protein [Prosthecobacter fusiformis]TDU70883.1 hypothetical protein EI77_02001 [Prosthecobacter fusiformis]
MSAYTKPILRFGLITPAVFNCLLLAGAVAGVSKLNTVRTEKQERYQEQTQRLAAMKKLEASIAPKRKAFEDQKKLLSADPGQLFTRILDGMLPKYKEIELERSSLVFPLDKGRFAREVKADSARVKSSFQGGLGPMQEALLQVESLMPQAVLEDMKISRRADLLIKQREFLVLEMTHTCWKATDEKP